MRGVSASCVLRALAVGDGEVDQGFVDMIPEEHKIARVGADLSGGAHVGAQRGRKTHQHSAPFRCTLGCPPVPDAGTPDTGKAHQAVKKWHAAVSLERHWGGRRGEPGTHLWVGGAGVGELPVEAEAAQGLESPLAENPKGEREVALRPEGEKIAKWALTAPPRKRGNARAQPQDAACEVNAMVRGEREREACSPLGGARNSWDAPR